MNCHRHWWCRSLAAGLLLVGLLFGLVAAVDGRPVETPVTPDASPEARALLNYFTQVSGKHVLAGQHDGGARAGGLSAELNYIQTNTGKLPAVLEFDVSDLTMPGRDEQHGLMQRAEAWAKQRGGIVALCWHWRAPVGAASFYTKETSFDINRAVTPGTPEYAGVQRDLERIASELERLRDAHVPVLWRPLHEANGRWFWWGAGGPEPCRKLWRMMFETFAVRHHLNNLIWMFSPGAETDLPEWYPGDAYVDIVGVDHYPMDGNHDSAKDIFDELKILTRGQKLLALGENGPIPDPAKLKQEGAAWIFFNTWTGSILFEKTTPAQLREYYQNPYVLTLADLPDWNRFAIPPPGAPVRLAFLGDPETVTVGGTWRMPLTVAVQDAEGRAVRESGRVVTLSLKHVSGATLAGPLTAETVNGVASFAGVTLDQPGRSYRLVASASGLRSATSAAFAVQGGGLGYMWWNGPEAVKANLTGALEFSVSQVTNYSARLGGRLIAPQTGEYQFHLAGAGRAELWLGSEAAPDMLQKIATLDGRTPYCKWPHASETEAVRVKLVKGHSYAFEIRRWQPAGSVQFFVCWQRPDGREERPIPASYFLPPTTNFFNQNPP